MANDLEISDKQCLGCFGLVAVIVLCITAYEIAKLIINQPK